MVKVGQTIVNAGAVHGEFASADASALTEANSRILLYPRGSATALAVGASDNVVVTEITVSTITALTIEVYDGADATPAAGEWLAKVIVAANSQPVTIPLKTPHVCKAGTWPKVKTSGAGQVYVGINGWVEKGPA